MPYKPTHKEIKNARARREAIERSSEKCQVIKAADSILDEEEFLDTKHCLEHLLNSLYQPEAKATRRVLQRILDIENKSNDKVKQYIAIATLSHKEGDRETIKETRDIIWSVSECEAAKEMKSITHK